MINLSGAWLIPLFPLAGFAVLLLGGRRLIKVAPFVGISAVSLSFVGSIAAAAAVIGGGAFEGGVSWFGFGGAVVKAGMLIDPLSVVMLVTVTSVSLLVQIYSIGYMKGEPRLAWYYAALSLFTSAMLCLVISNNFLQLYMSWELVGLCSYFLIGFWYEKKSASNAAMKAFIMTRIGDVGFFIGLLLLFTVCRTFDFTAIRELLAAGSLGAGVMTAVSLLFFCGAAGKSAQIPLYGWLPDAMEGPTPVSALIHAATMVAAGVYLIARSFFILEAAYPAAMTTIAVIGTLTALLAAAIAVTMSDIKKVLAYSTISQLGYMMAALGVGGYVAAVFHLFTHAFFKALLFLGAGSVIHGAATQNIYEMGGLMKKMRTTGITFLIATLSIAGVIPLSGFWSKDEILSAAAGSGNWLVTAGLLVAAFLTAFYMFRLFFTVFMGPKVDEHAHESPPVMTVPLMILAAPAALLGLAGAPFLGNAFASFVGEGGHHGEINYLVMSLSLGAAFTSILAAWSMFNAVMPEERFGRPLFYVYAFIRRRFFLDELIENTIVKPVSWVASLVARADESVFDTAIKGLGRLGMKGAKALGAFDKKVIDGAVLAVGAAVLRGSRQAARVDETVDDTYEGAARMIRVFSEFGRKIYSGSLSRYFGAILLGFLGLAMFVYLLFVLLK